MAGSKECCVSSSYAVLPLFQDWLQLFFLCVSALFRSFAGLGYFLRAEKINSPFAMAHRVLSEKDAAVRAASPLPLHSAFAYNSEFEVLFENVFAALIDFFSDLFSLCC